ncbi:isopeptide-forming domain-containing fimbrial protein [Enterococcus faecium]|nr:isopeptide-forming domain-containing fimbrial protein [Enterococcus faecium]EGP5602396.1 isopeptide-forming domain-containing fimbrial protein [Enterococcus faecium]EME7096360.1 isopeptide-forming domain-containing fimbrial protein [Enterococcus faecium]EME7159551.1 isopeptide-forming domain-containing fimbrial protein [Enterococcus faecium]EMF0589789.1 isopeptide-forming domain-containing fimbrial protein [Enterococcus faecium]
MMKENKGFCKQRTLILAFFFFGFFFLGRGVSALETVDPYAIKENNNLVLYHDSDSLRSIQVTGINGYKVYDAYKTKQQKAICWSKVKDLKNTSRIVVHYEKVGIYLGKEIDCDVTFSHFVAHAGVNEPSIFQVINGKKYYNYLLFDKNIYRGFYMQSINVMNVQLGFNYSGTKTKVKLGLPQTEIQSRLKNKNINLADTYLSTYSLNGQYQQRVSWFDDNNQSVGERNIDMKEFVGYEKMAQHPYYVTKDTSCGEYNAPSQSANKLCSKVVGGRAEKKYSSNGHFTDVVGSDTYHRSGVTFSVQGESPTFMIGANTNNMMFSFDTALLWTPQPEKPRKEVFNKAETEAPENNVDKKIIPQGSDVYYHIHQKFDALTVNSMNKYQSFTIQDTFDDKNFNPKPDGQHLDAALWYVDAKGKWIKADTGTISISGNKFSYQASGGFVKNSANYGKEYVLELHMKAKNEASGIAPNTATVTFNNDTGRGTQKTNTVENYFSLAPMKKVEQNGVDVNGRDKGDKGTSTGPLLSGSSVDYTIAQQWHKKGININNIDHYDAFVLEDPVEQRLIYTNGSAKVIDESTGKDVTEQGTISYDSNTHLLKWEASKDFLQNNSLDGRTLRLTFPVKTPLKEEHDIKNQGTAKINDIERKTNIVTIGVKPNLPAPKIARTGSLRMRIYSIIFVILFLGIGVFFYKVVKEK